jgi:ATP adenylyltransferase
MQFIGAPKPDGCIFCVLPAEQGADQDRKNLILGRSQSAFAILNRYPYNNGHLMVIPRRHTAEFASLGEAELLDLHRLLQVSLRLLDEAYRPAGANVGMNLGKAAGAGIEDHLHYHVVPRWDGDTNFMPVLAQTKVMIELLDQTYATLRPLFDRELGAAP